MDIFLRPLRDQDKTFNRGIYNKILEDIEAEERKRKKANDEFGTRRRESLQFDASDSSTEVLELDG